MAVPRRCAFWRNSLRSPLVAPRMSSSAPAPLDGLLETVDVTVTQTRRAEVSRGRRFSLPGGSLTLVYVADGALHGEPAVACAPDPLRPGGVIAQAAAPDTFPAGAALLTLGRMPLTFEALHDTTLVVVDLELNEAASRLRQLLPDPLTMLDFSRIDPAVSALASNMGVHTDGATPTVDAGGAALVCRLMARTLLLSLLRAWVSAGCAPSGWAARAVDPHLDPIISAIHSDPGRDWSVDALASLGTMSRSAVSRRFRELLGASPGQYITVVRMEDAKRRLAQGASVTQISRELGYASDEGFSRAFRRHTGLPPSRWRAADPHADGAAVRARSAA